MLRLQAGSDNQDHAKCIRVLSMRKRKRGYDHESRRCPDKHGTDSIQKTGLVLPRQGIFLATIENLGRQLILVDFGSVSSEYLFPNEIMAQPVRINESLATALSNQ